MRTDLLIDIDPITGDLWYVTYDDGIAPDSFMRRSRSLVQLTLPNFILNQSGRNLSGGSRECWPELEEAREGDVVQFDDCRRTVTAVTDRSVYFK